MSKHTPAPWDAVDEGHAVVIYGGADVDSQDRPTVKPVCEVADTDHEEANARLIAAAPDLLAALDNIMGYFRSGNEIPVERATIMANAPEIEAARAALKKARGEC